MRPKKIVLASCNTKKLDEYYALFSSLAIELITQSKLSILPIDEPYDTFIENALHKARHASLITGLPALADDSGLCVVSLNGLPGIYSARFAGEIASDDTNNQLLLEKMQAITKRDAYYYCMLVLVRHSKDPSPLIAEGIWSGKIMKEPRGKNGFGYDPLFYLPALHLTAAEIDPMLKNQLSHRAQAFKVLFDKICSTEIAPQ
jgi:XTP/dITP diphosphohydrolase